MECAACAIIVRLPPWVQPVTTLSSRPGCISVDRDLPVRGQRRPAAVAMEFCSAGHESEDRTQQVPGAREPVQINRLAGCVVYRGRGWRVMQADLLRGRNVDNDAASLRLHGKTRYSIRAPLKQTNVRGLWADLSRHLLQHCRLCCYICTTGAQRASLYHHMSPVDAGPGFLHHERMSAAV